MLETFTCSTFSPLVSETFRLDAGGEVPVDLILVEAGELPQASPRAGRTPFSLMFEGPADVVYPQRSYRLEHPALGGFDLFIVPIDADAGGVRYQAIFS